MTTDPDPVKMSKRGSTKEKHREHKFAEGWVEFEDKRVARSVAEMLNANSIGVSQLVFVMGQFGANLLR